MRRFAPLVAGTLTTAAAIIVSATFLAAEARFRFGTMLSAARPAPAIRDAPAIPPAGAPGVSSWTGCGVKLTPDVTNGVLGQAVLPDGAGGVTIVWTDSRTGNGDGYASRLNSDGDYVSGWTADGNALSVSDSNKILVGAADDGSGGIFTLLSYLFTSGSVTFRHAFLQHLTASGTLASGYPANGKSLVSGGVGTVEMLPDGAGGMFFGWSAPSGSTIRVKRLDATGAVTGGWPANGLDTGIPDAARGSAELDGAGGLYAIWVSGNDILVQRFDANGVVSGWPAGGVVVHTATNPIPNSTLGMVRLSSGDVLAVWNDTVTGHVTTQRVTAAGAVHGSWPAAGLDVSTGTTYESLTGVIPDGAGGALVSWVEAGPPSNSFMQRVTATGGISSGWPALGIPVASVTFAYDATVMIGDGANGALLAWVNYQNSPNGPVGDVYAKHVLAAGAADPAWPAGGVKVCQGDDTYPAIATDNAGGAIVTWLDYSDPANAQVRAARVLADGTVSALASLVEATAEPGRVRLLWFTPDGSVGRATVERAEAGGEFQAVGEVTADGAGYLRFEDRDVVPGTSYQYRLAVLDATGTAYLGQVTIQVPASLAFGIDGIRPNPAAELTVSFTLASGAPARLELLDVTGRRVLAREVGSLGAGRHLLRLENTKGLPAGIYSLLLTQGGRDVVTRAAIIR